MDSFLTEFRDSCGVFASVCREFLVRIHMLMDVMPFFRRYALRQFIVDNPQAIGQAAVIPVRQAAERAVMVVPARCSGTGAGEIIADRNDVIPLLPELFPLLLSHVVPFNTCRVQSLQVFKQ
jgi:hypothetical protein